MAKIIGPIKTTNWEDTDTTFLSREYGNDAELITQSAMSSISYSVWDVSGSTPTSAIVSASSLTVSAVVYDTLQNGQEWDLDEIGYNFKYTVAGSNFNAPRHMYQVEFIFNPSSGGDWPLVFHHTTLALMTS